MKSRGSLLVPPDPVVPEKGPQNGCGGGDSGAQDHLNHLHIPSVSLPLQIK